MIRNQKIEGTFICGPLLFKWMDVFQSWLDCFSIGVRAFIQNINFLSSVDKKSKFEQSHPLQRY